MQSSPSANARVSVRCVRYVSEYRTGGSVSAPLSTVALSVYLTGGSAVKGSIEDTYVASIDTSINDSTESHLVIRDVQYRRVMCMWRVGALSLSAATCDVFRVVIIVPRA